jgi:hypothetical protein
VVGTHGFDLVSNFSAILVQDAKLNCPPLTVQLPELPELFAFCLQLCQPRCDALQLHPQATSHKRMLASQSLLLCGQLSVLLAAVSFGVSAHSPSPYLRLSSTDVLFCSH